MSSATCFSRVLPDHAEEALVACLDSNYEILGIPGTNGNHPCSWKVASGETAAFVSFVETAKDNRIEVWSASEEFARGVFLAVEGFLDTILIENILNGKGE